MTGWLAQALFSSTLLMLLVLALRRPVARLFGAHMAYALWALPVLRLLMPPVPGWTSPLGVDRWLAPDAHPAGLVAPPVDLPAPVFAAPPPVDASWLAMVDPWQLLLLGWSLGALLWFGWQMLRYRRFLDRAMRDAVVLPCSDAAEVLVCSDVDGPVAAGIMRRRILLPADFLARYSPAEQRLALLHETAHHDRGDLAANFASLLVLALHWWNPVAHFAHRAFRVDQELACDATVLAGEAPAARRDYAVAVLKSATARTPAAACAMNHKSQLKQRITMMKMPPNSLLRTVVGGAFALAIGSGALALTAAGAVPAPVAPAAVAPPVAPAAAVVPVAPAAPATVASPAAPGAPGVAGAAPAPPQPPRMIVIRTEKHGGKPGKPAGDKDVSVMMFPAGEGFDPATLPSPDEIDAQVQKAMADAHKAHGEALKAGKQARVVAIKRLHCRKLETAGESVVTCDNSPPINVSAIRRESLESARQAIETTAGLTDEQRRAALDGIDKAIAAADQRPATSK